VALTPDYPPGATPLNPDELEGVIPAHITTQGQLNEWEQKNILEGERWAFSRKRANLLSTEFTCALHKRMFGETWSWAGQIRQSEKNIGIDPTQIRPALHDLFENVKAQIANKSCPIDEIAARFSHRFVWIHPFANGNGRTSRTMTDLLLVSSGASRFDWGDVDLAIPGEARNRYLNALRAADQHDHALLLAFVRSRL
jgi:Fic-DOC domain mobile mystery protein B